MKFNPDEFVGEVIVQDGFFEFIEKVKKTNVRLPNSPEIVSSIGAENDNIQEGGKLTAVEGGAELTHKLDLINGESISKKESTLISAYDESIAKFSCLEGKAVYVSHSLIYVFGDRYYPLNMLTAMFVTGSDLVSRRISDDYKVIATNEKWGADTTANVEIAKQKRDFLEKYCYDDSILLIDGPFLAGDGLAYFKAVKKAFVDRRIIPIFIVKNSASRMIIDTTSAYCGKYNSDLHWANEILNAGERTRFYKYTDNKDNTKVFCYLKFNKGSSPIRIEMPTEIYSNFTSEVISILDLVYYLIMVQGDYLNPQARPVAIAEKYARETLHLIDFSKLMRSATLTPTINEERGMER